MSTIRQGIYILFVEQMLVFYVEDNDHLRMHFELYKLAN